MNFRKNNAILIVMSLLSIVLSLIHVTDDVVRGKDRFPNHLGMLIWVVWLCGTLLLAERRSGQIIMLLGGILSTGLPVVHARGIAAAAKTSGAFLFLGTLFALGVIGMFSIIVSARGLWLLRKGGDADTPPLAIPDAGDRHRG